MDELATQMSQSFQDELQKIAKHKVAGIVDTARTVGKAVGDYSKKNKNWMIPAAAGGAGTAVLLQANSDRRLGRQIRKAQRR